MSIDSTFCAFVRVQSFSMAVMSDRADNCMVMPVSLRGAVV
jgi:hypothetical protein